MTEKQFQQQVMDLAKMYGWEVYHTWKSIHSPAGYPDLCMVKPGRLLYAELKTETGKITQAQQKWIDLLSASGKCEVYVWRPSGWTEIQEILTK